MRENRPYGSEGGEAQSLPDPYRPRDDASTRPESALEPLDPGSRILRQDFPAPFFRDRAVEHPVERVERCVRPIRGIEQPVLAAAHRHQPFEVLRLAREADRLAGEADIGLEILAGQFGQE